jgi:hypothetical protein
MLTAAQVAAVVGVLPSTWRSYVARGWAPPPDGHLGATPWWAPATVQRWREQWNTRHQEEVPDR